MPHLEHIGIAVEDPEAVARLYETLLGARPYKRERVEREGVQTHFIAADTAKLELLEALGPDSPVARFLEKRSEGLHHLAFEVDDVHAQMQRLRQAGFTPLSDAPRPGADGKLIFFLHPRQTHGVLVEFCQSVPSPFDVKRLPFGEGVLDAWERGDAHNPPLVVLPGAPLPEAEALVRHLEPHFYVFALDVGAPAIDAAEGALALLDFLDVRQAHLLGVAAGGHAALRLARRHPQRVARLAVHAAGLDGAPDAVSRIEQPVLVSAVDGDPLVPPEDALALHRALPHSTLAVLPGTRPGVGGLDAALYVRLLRRHFG